MILFKVLTKKFETTALPLQCCNLHKFLYLVKNFPSAMEITKYPIFDTTRRTTERGKGVLPAVILHLIKSAFKAAV
jgi:hypothetical protein